MFGRDYSLVGKRESRIWSIGREVKGKNQFGNPIAIAINSKASIAVVDQLNHRVQFVSEVGNLGPVIGTKGSGPDQLKNPAGVNFSSEGQLTVCDSSNNRIQVYGSFQYSVDQNLGEAGQNANQCNSPNGVVWAGEALIVADTGNHRIVVWNQSGVGIPDIRFGKRGDKLGQFSFPVDVDFWEGALKGSDESNFVPSWFIGSVTRAYCIAALQGCEPGTFFVRDVNIDNMSIVWCPPDFAAVGEVKETVVKIMNNRFHVQAKEGSRWAGFPSLHDLLLSQTNLKMPPDRRRRGLIAVSDQSNNRVQILHYTPAFSLLVPPILRPLQAVGDNTYPPGARLKSPSKLCFNSMGDLIVCDTGNHQVVIYGSDFSFLHSFGAQDGLQIPLSIACDSSDCLILGTRHTSALKGGQVHKFKGPRKLQCGVFAKLRRKCAALVFQFINYWEATNIAGTCRFLSYEMATMRSLWELAPFNPIDLVRLKLCFRKWARKVDGTSLPVFEPKNIYGIKTCDKYLSTRKCDRLVCPYSHESPILDDDEMDTLGACMEFENGVYHCIIEVIGSIFWWDNQAQLQLVFARFSTVKNLFYYWSNPNSNVEVIRVTDCQEKQVLSYAGFLKFITVVFEHLLGLQDWAVHFENLENKPVNPSTGLEASVVLHETFEYQLNKACSFIDSAFL